MKVEYGEMKIEYGEMKVRRESGGGVKIEKRGLKLEGLGDVKS